MSIVSPKDTIIVEIDGLTGAFQMKLSRDLPGLYVISILTQLCTFLANQGLQAAAGAALPVKGGNDATQKSGS